MQIGDRQFVQKIVGINKVIPCLAGAADDDIHTYAASRHERLNHSDPFGIELALVATTHLGEHLVTSGLQRHMEVWDKSFGLCYKFNNLVRKQVGFDR